MDSSDRLTVVLAILFCTIWAVDTYLEENTKIEVAKYKAMESKEETIRADVLIKALKGAVDATD